MDISTLKDRLRGVVRPASELIAPADESVRLKSDTPSVLGGAWRETPSGRSFVIRERFGPDQLHGRHRVIEFADILDSASPAASLVGRSSTATPFVFFDLETTGLNGGAGTHA